MHRRLAGGERVFQGTDLLQGLDRPRMLEDLLAIGQREARVTQRGGGVHVQPVHRQADVAAAMLVDQVGDFLRECPGDLFAAIAGHEVIRRPCRANLVNGLEPPQQVHAGGQLEHEGRPGGHHQRIAAEVMHGPHLHIARSVGVADIDRVEQQRCGDVFLRGEGADAFEAVELHRNLVDRHADIEGVRHCRVTQLSTIPTRASRPSVRAAGPG